MSAVQVQRVASRREMDQLLTFPWRLYRDDPLWVPPVLTDRRRRVDPQHCPFLQRGEADFFLARRDGAIVGTICAAHDPPTNEDKQRKDAIFGFFECVNDPEVAAALVERAQRWAATKGLTNLIGPFDLDYEDSYGVLIEGWDSPPAVLCGHNPPYYRELLEGLGFQKARGDALAYEIELDTQTPEIKRLLRLAEWVRSRGRVTVRGANLDDYEAEVDRVYELINQALQHLPNFTPWQRAALQDTMAKFRPHVDPELVLFAEAEGQLVGWLPGVPNLNEALIHANGLRYPWDYLRAWWELRRRPDCLALKSVLVRHDHWDTGVPVLLFAEMAQRAAARGYRWADLSLTSEANPTTPLLAEHMGARVYKRYRVYQRPVHSSRTG